MFDAPHHRMSRWRAVAVTALAGLVASVVGTVAATAAVSTGGGRAAAQVQSPAQGPYFPGYWLAASDGGVYQFQTTNFGSLRGDPLNRPVVAGAATDDGLGYWLVASDGGIFSFGDAKFEGSTGGITLNKPIVAMAADPANSHAYWMVGSDGGVFAYGGAGFYGSTGNVRLNKPIVAIVPTLTGRGYWLVASDGGVFNFGDAKFYGSTGNVRLNKPVVGMAANPNGGYWLVASDGGIFSFGGAGFYGSTGGITLNKPVVGISAAPDGKGYWMAASDGGVFNFGSAPFLGSSGSGPAPVVAILTTAHGYPFPPGSTGNDISQYQCPPYATIPVAEPGIRIVQASDGAINSSTANPCYAAEAAWGGVNLSSYIFMDTLPASAPPEADAAACGGSVTCEGYHFGFYWARWWVGYSEGLGYNPSLWWLDVETDGDWSQSPAVNAQVIAGAVAGVRSMGRGAGIYATSYQWNIITGSSVSFPGIPLWVPGAYEVSQSSSAGYPSAQQICSQTIPDPTAAADHSVFAGGNIVLVQYGYGVSPTPTYDLDYACP